VAARDSLAFGFGRADIGGRSSHGNRSGGGGLGGTSPGRGKIGGGQRNGCGVMAAPPRLGGPDGARFGRGLTVPKMRAMASEGRKLA
jgi:hypothetical protein